MCLIPNPKKEKSVLLGAPRELTVEPELVELPALPLSRGRFQ